ncbi:MAG: hypothetical protein ACTSWC_05125 [Promethearchaeota archaeon]
MPSLGEILKQVQKNQISLEMVYIDKSFGAAAYSSLILNQICQND